MGGPSGKEVARLDSAEVENVKKIEKEKWRKEKEIGLLLPYRQDGIPVVEEVGLLSLTVIFFN